MGDECRKDSKIVTDEMEFRFHIIQELGAMKAEQVGMKTDLKYCSAALGTHTAHVEELFARMNKVEQHPGTCPFGVSLGKAEVRITTLETNHQKHMDDVARGDQKKTDIKNGLVIPLVRSFLILALGAFLMLVGMHIQELRDDHSAQTKASQSQPLKP